MDNFIQNFPQIARNVVLFSNHFFFWYLVIYATYILICVVFGSFSMYRYRKMDNLHNVLEHEFYYPMSIIVPAYNESLTIIQNINNLLMLDYKLYEIIVVDDGSTDDTKEKVVNFFKMEREDGRPIRYDVPCQPINEIYSSYVNGIRVTLVSKENGGCKADAANAAINVAEYPYVVNIDADEILQRDSLKLASRAILEDDNVVCVGGNIKMSNYVSFKNAMPVETTLGKNMIVDMQVIEYGRAFVGSRILQNNVNMNLIVSGGYGIFKKSVLIAVGGYDTKSMGEDMEMTVRIHEHFRKNKETYAMKYVPDSVCWTQGPSSMKDLRKQRERWYCGLIQTLSKYKHMILNPKYGLIGLFMMPYVIMYELLNPVFMILGWFVIIWTFIDKSVNFPYVLYIYGMYLAFSIFLSIVSFWDKMYMKKDTISLKKMWIAFYTSVVDSLFFRMFISIISFFAIFKIKKLKGKWESPERVVVESVEDLDIDEQTKQ